MDSNPRRFILHVNAIDVDLNTIEGQDEVALVVAGHLTPALKRRLQEAMSSLVVDVTERKLV